jgi:hypothetical protein
MRRIIVAIAVALVPALAYAQIPPAPPQNPIGAPVQVINPNLSLGSLNTSNNLGGLTTTNNVGSLDATGSVSTLAPSSAPLNVGMAGQVLLMEPLPMPEPQQPAQGYTVQPESGPLITTTPPLTQPGLTSPTTTTLVPTTTTLAPTPTMTQIPPPTPSVIVTPIVPTPLAPPTPPPSFVVPPAPMFNTFGQ